MLKMNCNILLIVLILECLSLKVLVYCQKVQPVVQNRNKNPPDSTNNTKSSSMNEDAWLDSLLKDINTPLENVNTNLHDIQNGIHGSSVFSLSDVVEINSTKHFQKEPNSKDLTPTKDMPLSGNDQNLEHGFDVFDKKPNPKVVHTSTRNSETTVEKPTDFLFFQGSPNEKVINIGKPSKVSPKNDQNQNHANNILEKTQHSKNIVHTNTKNRLIITSGKQTDFLFFKDAPKGKTIQNNLQTINKDRVISHIQNVENSREINGHDQVLPEHHTRKVTSNDLYLQLQNIIKRLLNLNSNPSSSKSFSGHTLFGGQSRYPNPWDITDNNFLKVKTHFKKPHPEPETEPQPVNADNIDRRQSEGNHGVNIMNSFLKMYRNTNAPRPEPEVEPHPEQFFPSHAGSNARSHPGRMDGHNAVNGFINIKSHLNILQPKSEVVPRLEPFLPMNAGSIVLSQLGGIEGHNTVNSFLKINSHPDIPHPESEVEPHPEQVFQSNTGSIAQSQLGGTDDFNAVNSFLKNSNFNIPYPEPEVEPQPKSSF